MIDDVFPRAVTLTMSYFGGAGRQLHAGPDKVPVIAQQRRVAHFDGVTSHHRDGSPERNEPLPLFAYGLPSAHDLSARCRHDGVLFVQRRQGVGVATIEGILDLTMKISCVHRPRVDLEPCQTQQITGA